MTCAACQAAVERAISSLPGVQSVSVNLLTNSAVISFDETVVGEEEIFSAVKRAGYSASTFVKREESERKELILYRNTLRRLILSAVFAFIMMYVTMGHMVSLPLPSFMDPHGTGYEPLIYAAVQFALAAPVIIINRSYFSDGIRGALSGSPNMNTLVGLGASASMVYGIYIFVKMIIGYLSGEMIHVYSEQLYFESVTMILTLITLGRTLEARARRHTSDAIRKLMDLTPKTAEVIRDGMTQTVSTDSLYIGDTVIVRAGSSVPCDGRIITGGGAADESVITGESIPVQKNVGDTLICGTVLVAGYAEFAAESVGEDTTVAKITELCENAASGKAPEQKLADRISSVFVPAVCAVALLAFCAWLIFTKDLYKAVTFGISVLVISCPCSLGLATPTAIMCGIGRGASLGILIKSADAIDVLAKASVAVLDKTGTVTEGKMHVSSVFASDGMTEKELLSVAASLESMSEHPIGKAVVEYAAKMGLSPLTADEYTQSFGGGVSGLIDGKLCTGGNAEFTEKSGVTLDATIKSKLDEYSHSGNTPIIFSCGGKVIGIIALSDKIRETSAKAVESLDSLGLDVIMLTGDNGTTAHAVAESAGIKAVIPNVKPEDKSTNVEQIMAGDYYGDTRRRYVIMVGDGVNDAPALTMADCGIAVAYGTDIAIESAGVVLQRNDLCDVSRAVRLARYVKRIIKENLMWAFGYNIICIPIAAGVLFVPFGIALTPMLASAAMSLSSVFVVCNSLRVKRFSANGTKNDV